MRLGSMFAIATLLWQFPLTSLSRYNPISEAELETIIGQIYITNPPAMDDKLHPHYLAILFSILAIGTLLDLDRPPFSPEAAHYYQLGRAALSLKSVLEEQSITAIRALVSISTQ
jgi:hypothetical protein